MTEISITRERSVQEHATWIVIDREALLHNLTEIMGCALPGASVLAVVKANAYGHGLLQVAKSLHEKVAYLGVSTIEEALELREAEIETPILLFGIPLPNAVEVAIRADVSISISSVEQAQAVSEVAGRFNQPAAVHIKVDTGMGRLGIPAQEAAASIERIASLNLLKLEGIYTHFPQSQQGDDPYTREQILRFNQIVEAVSKKGIHIPFRHAANSAGIMNYKESHFNLVRPGITLYGILPDENLAGKLNLRPVLHWRARIIQLKPLRRGASTGYDRTYVAGEDTQVGILPVGYGHGYAYSLSNHSEVLFRGRRYPVAGRVSMDYLAVDFGRAPLETAVGESVTLLGRDGDEEICVEDMAKRAGTIPYEIVTRLSSIIPRYLL